MSENSDVLFVKSKIKKIVNDGDLSLSSKVLNGTRLNDLITTILENAMKRARLNGRKTVQEKDL